MTYRLIATDLDETLLTKTRNVSSRNREAIEKARARGVKFVLATGRPYFSTLGTQEEINVLHQKGEYTISLNGAVVIDNETEKPLFVEGLPFETINMLFQKSLNYDVGVHVYTDNAVYGYKMSEDEWAYCNGRMEVIGFDTPSLDFIKDENFVKILFVNTDQDYLRQIAKDLEEETRNLEVSYSSNRYIEFNKSGIHKGYGLLKLGEKLGISPEEMIGIGDNFNDLAMIEAAGLGVGVANVNPRMKDRCDYVTEADYQHDAIAEVIDRFILNESIPGVPSEQIKE